MLKLLIPAVLLSAILPDAAAAQQQRHADIRVAYRDLNLQSPAGLKVLDRRIRRAIEAVCPDFAGSTVPRHPEVARCRAAKEAEVASQRAAALAYAARSQVQLAAVQADR